MEDPNTRRVVLLGKTGSGKSSLANALFGGNYFFPVNHEPDFSSKICMSKTKTVNGRSLQLIDTPGFFDSDPRSSELSPELLQCIMDCAPGPHAFLLVLKVQTYTVSEQAFVTLMLRYFSKDVLNYTTVVFTHGDDLPRETKIEEWVEQNEELDNLVRSCGGRCHVIDNQFANINQRRKKQIEELLRTIERMVSENRGGHYANEMLQQVHAKIQHQASQIRKSSGSISSMELQREAKESVLRDIKSAVTGRLLGAFIGGMDATAMTSVPDASLLWALVGGAAGAALMGPLGGVLGLGLAKKLTETPLKPAEREAKSYMEHIELLFRQWQSIKRNMVEKRGRN